MKIPQFLYVPRTNTLGTTKLILETRKNVYWQIIEFVDRNSLFAWLRENQLDLSSKANTVTVHNKYPYLLLNIGIKTEVTAERLVKLGEMASDWYAQFYLKNKELSKLKFKEKDNFSDKVKEYFKHWRWGDNLISHNGAMTLINLAYGLSVHFNYGDAFFASFEDFENNISDIQFINGERPNEAKVHELLIDAWNFMSIQEKIEDGFEIEELDDDSIFNTTD